MNPGEAIPVFFYGGLINEEMQKRADVRPLKRVRAVLPGYAITICPWVNLEQSGDDAVFGVVMWLDHSQLERLYGQLQVRYFPVAVLARTTDDTWQPALCYIAHAMPPGQADESHVRMLLEPAIELGFPAWYLDRIRSFLPNTAEHRCSN